MSNLYRGPSIDASYQVSVYLAKLFQRRIFIEIDQSETRIACGWPCLFKIGTKLKIPPKNEKIKIKCPWLRLWGLSEIPGPRPMYRLNPPLIDPENYIYGKLYSKQFYVMKFVRNLPQVIGFLWVPGSPTINEGHNIQVNTHNT